MAVALERFVDEYELDGLAYYYEGEPESPMRQLVTNLIVGNSLLTAAGFPMCGESDLKTCVAMLIEDRLDIGGSFAEFHPIDFKEGFVLVGHDGPHHLNIADGKPALRSLTKYHGKPGSGASVEFRIKEGPITMLGIGVAKSGKFKFVIAEGESARGPIPPTGNTNTRGFFEPDIKTFLKRWVAEGPTHHFALGIGHHGGIAAEDRGDFEPGERRHLEEAGMTRRRDVAGWGIAAALARCASQVRAQQPTAPVLSNAVRVQARDARNQPQAVPAKPVRTLSSAPAKRFSGPGRLCSGAAIHAPSCCGPPMAARFWNIAAAWKMSSTGRDTWAMPTRPRLRPPTIRIARGRTGAIGFTWSILRG